MTFEPSLKILLNRENIPRYYSTILHHAADCKIQRCAAGQCCPPVCNRGNTKHSLLSICLNVKCFFDFSEPPNHFRQRPRGVGCSSVSSSCFLTDAYMSRTRTVRRSCVCPSAMMFRVSLRHSEFYFRCVFFRLRDFH